MRKQSYWLYAALILSFAVASATAQEYTSPREVLQNEDLRQDFSIQGEYLATTAENTVGLHMIADGGGKFRAVLYQGGLPGNGWKTGDARYQGTATVSGEEITFTYAAEGPFKGEYKGKVVIEPRPQGGGGGGTGFRGTPVKIEIASFELALVKQFRTSPTMGLAAPAGALVLFDGTNVDQFESGAQMNEQQRGGNTLWAEATAKPFEKKPYTMHVEFMTSYMPTKQGQARSNSGVYLDERYECQVLDSFGLVAKNDDCGGFYQVAAPLVNMCFPPLTWQTYDFEFTPARYDGNRKVDNARVTVKHNGVVIHDNITLPKETPGRKAEGPAPLGVYLQGHGNKVQYRNIWVQYKDWVAPVAVVEAEAPVDRTNSGRRVRNVPETEAAQPVGAEPAPEPVESVLLGERPTTARRVRGGAESTATVESAVEVEAAAPAVASPVRPMRRVVPQPFLPRLRALFL